MIKTREEYKRMLETREFDLTKDQIALVASASLLNAHLKHSTGWGILISLGLVQFYKENPNFLISTVKGDALLERYSKIELFRMLKAYRGENGIDYLYQAAIYLIPLISHEELPELLVDSNKGVRTVAAKQLFWHKSGRYLGTD